jgi:phosphohistidine phosphatase
MARQLWLLRHAEAEPHGSRADSERKLTTRGEAQARAAGLALSRLDVLFESVLFSPKVRARQTAVLAAEAWSAEQRECLAEYPPLAGDFAASGAREALHAVSPDGRLLLVGHEPDLSRLLYELTGVSADFKKGGVAAVRLEGASGELIALLRPRELALIAGVPAGGQ